MPVVIVGGTNGKGTTSGFLAQLLSTCGVKVGLFTSPHLEHFNERFWISGEQVSDRQLVVQLRVLRAGMPANIYDEMSFFEVNTLLAMQLFSAHAVDLIILEVGLGGRWDSTNAFDPCLSVITSIGLDHMEFLGDSVAEIAAEKAGIMRPGTPVIWAGAVDDADGIIADQVILREAEARGSHLLRPDLKRWQGALPEEVKRLPGYLRRNFATALTAFAELGYVDRVQSAAAQVLSGAVSMPPSLRGRFQYLRLARPFRGVNQFLLDACHNPHGAVAFAAALKETLRADERPAAVVSILRDKDHAKILDILRSVCGHVVLFANHSERSWSQDDIAQRHRDLVFFDDFGSAVAAITCAESPVVVCGSVHLIGEVLSQLRPYVRTGES